MNMMAMQSWQSPSKIEQQETFCGHLKSWNKNLIARGLTPILMTLENDASQLLKDYVYDKKSVSSWYRHIVISGAIFEGALPKHRRSPTPPSQNRRH
jgi:hypothetical protein